jgi:TRAP transporter TAXI family solute receptor
MAVRWTRQARPGSRGWVLLALAVAVTVAVGIYLRQASPPRRITLATGQEGGMYDTYGHEYERQLGRLGLKVDVVRSNGSIDNLRRLLARTADVAFIQSGTYRMVDDHAGILRGVAALYVEPLWIFYRGAGRLDGISALGARAISIGPAGSGTEAVARALLERHAGVQTRTINLPSPEARRLLESGALDAAFFVTSYRDAGIQELLRRPDLKLMGFRHDEAYTRNFPALSAVKISAGLFDLGHDIPAEDVTLLAPAAILVCRETLHPRVIEMLLDVARAVHGPGDLLNAPRRFPSLEGVDIPLHETAESYLTSGESFLSRTLPYWAFRWVFLVPLLAIWFPALRLLPELYQLRGSRVVSRCYARLHDAEATLLRAECRDDLEAGIAAGEALGREVTALALRLPDRPRRDLYQWRHHLSLVLDEARERLRRMPLGREGPGGS